MYADHSIDGEMIRWTLRDRYGNIATTPMTGTLARNAESNVTLNFENGIAKTPLQ
jgi:hypothetical protein